MESYLKIYQKKKKIVLYFVCEKTNNRIIYINTGNDNINKLILEEILLYMLYKIKFTLCRKYNKQQKHSIITIQSYYNDKQKYLILKE